MATHPDYIDVTLPAGTPEALSVEEEAVIAAIADGLAWRAVDEGRPAHYAMQARQMLDAARSGDPAIIAHAAALASPASTVEPGLDEAWKAAEAASLSTGASSGGWVVIAIERTPNEPVEYRAIERSGQPHEYGPWANTPAAALLALAARLSDHPDTGEPK